MISTDLLASDGNSCLQLRHRAYYLPRQAICKQHVVRDGDTCLGLVRANNMSFSQMIAWNPILKPACVNFNDLYGQNICLSNPTGSFALPRNTHGAKSASTITTQAPKPTPLPNTTDTYCGQYYRAAKGDSCSTIKTMFGISMDDFLFLNPGVGEDCSRLRQDDHYCVRPVGSISTYRGYRGTPTGDDGVAWVEMSMKPGPTRDLMGLYRPQKPEIPIADRTRLDCSEYFWTDEDDYACYDLFVLSDAPLEDFLLWNPSLAQNETQMNATACTLSASKSYCLELNTPPPRPVEQDPPAVSHCSDIPTTITSAPSPPASPATKRPPSTTSTMPSPVQAGISPACTSFHKVLLNDTCIGIAQRQKLVLPDLYAWNPALEGDCSGLQANTYICVAGPRNATGPQAPTPTQAGMVAQCKRFYKVRRDEGCWDIAHSAKIRLQDFYKWNPAVKEDCSGLQSDVYVCIGV
ncbi:hypothetical protein TgHK011_006888 [Trichoderma gracile]|nr:hypothetical protein TgHK011_006888 [Trichoderma gracile]